LENRNFSYLSVGIVSAMTTHAPPSQPTINRQPLAAIIKNTQIWLKKLKF